MSEADGAGTEEPPADGAGSANEVTLEKVGEAFVLRVTGALDLAVAPKLRRLVDRVQRLTPSLLVIDLTEVSFLASTGMTELVRADRLAASTAVRVVATGRITLRPLELARLTDELAIRPALGRVGPQVTGHGG